MHEHRPGAETRPPLTPPRPVEVLPPGAIRTPRLLLRPLVASDREAFLALIDASREHLARFSELHLPGESDGALFERQVRLTAEGEVTGRACRRMIVGPGGALLGACNFNAIRRGLSLEADLNWWLGAGHTGRGYASEAIGAMVRYALADLPDGLGLHRVLACIQEANSASIRLAERLGFEPLGEERTTLHTGGHWDLHRVYSLTPEAFERARAVA
jgi:[ribosomal protein S5]-alanine N-acetyltransferase